MERVFFIDYVEKREFRLLLKYTREYFELYQLFSQMGEKAGDKRVNLEEFKTAVPLLKEWGVDIEDPEETFKAIDKDKGGQILFDEFANWAMKENLDSPDDDEPEAETAPTDSATVPTAPAEPSAEAEPAEPLAAENAEPAEAPAA
ncbi:Flagellar calcium-binding protein TB-1.7G (17 kDa calcimedin) (17 kDa calflagin) (Fragment) [Durusdinium trenchii]|uniref:Flagellar calcium-binding protein TB-1.7G (17 kDa calcimedin) (17 kDa calflagin) n=1 Tax=Durusdinium trenchii TaxID=1381693 RepID=A0ABP0MNQ5_9DINO